MQVKKPIYSSSLRKWPAYTQGLAPLLVEVSGAVKQLAAQALQCDSTAAGTVYG
jgi:hypothetical protein